MSMTTNQETCSVKIYNEDCILPEHKLPDESVNLGIFDPPFGIGETGFDKHYKRDADKIIPGYIEAPDDYEIWTHKWMSEAKRVLHHDGSMYVVMGHSNLRSVLNAAHNLGLITINHLIWKYNFGVNTKRKFVTSHYHILYLKKEKEVSPVFNTYCRFGQQEKTKEGGSQLYQDMEDVFVINKDYEPGQIKNENKLPNALLEKLILYSSNSQDVVCDFFMGNFTTAYVARALGRRVCGYELNEQAYSYHMPLVKELKLGSRLAELKVVENKYPENQGKPIDDKERLSICTDYTALLKEGKMKKDISFYLQTKYGRGKFSIKNILDTHLTNN